ncbi:disulfide bond formation protein B [Salipiger mucosus]|uniref:Periplasmic thiol:disulfide oxidoreductase DsbB, required for DsbA reoxidation n=1 Tax=Salipiger mucosus DSM 16094 TaxID=1123237 RepID=S9RK57_9RHOB|nr:disulfide bond formation protein B [Salipiger mucosus]EPX78500.1 Periplasmic thiol:disulfide oxidoreductase DsbB, required for DsbA reoxidation [Salipiger mucosus DSM 16094]
MKRSLLILLAAGGSAALLLGALAFQHWGGLAPCKLCIWQRWPHGAAIGIGLAALAVRGAALPLLGALAALTSGGIGVYHTGVERGWWPGPDSCTSGSIEGLSTDDLVNQIMNAPVTRCDDVAWELLGLSMASWNALICLGLAALWLMAAKRG